MQFLYAIFLAILCIEHDALSWQGRAVALVTKSFWAGEGHQIQAGHLLKRVITG
jgi:hypothetical protein